MSIFANTKDRIVETAALSYLNGKLLLPYGKATSLKLDSTAKRIAITAELKGESIPVEIAINGYEITANEGRHFIQIEEIRTSREWLTTLATQHLCKKRFELPEKVGSIVAQAL